MIYLDYAATSFKKPETVYEAADRALREYSGNPGRSGHRFSIEAGRIVDETREICSRFFNIENPENLIFCSSCTDALNMAIHGILCRGDHVITSQMEHNSVARPLEYHRHRGVEVTKLETSPDTGVDPESIRRAVKENTRLVVLSHISNVTGTVNDIASAGRICREMGILFLVDAAQSAGARNIDVQSMDIDLLAFPGHKCLYGPQGTGGLYIRSGVDVQPFRQGGTGNRSELLDQPGELPYRYESGTLNVPGIAGLGAGVQFIMDEGLSKIAARENELAGYLSDELRDIAGVHVYGPGPGGERGPVVSVNVDGYDPQETVLMLDQIFGIAVRGGLHCAPDAHRMNGTFEHGGTVRISPGYFTTEEEVEKCIEGIKMISSGTL